MISEESVTYSPDASGLSPTLTVPYFRPSLTEAEIEETVDTLRSGWLTTGPRVKRFEREFALAVGSQHALAVNSCTAALHLAVEALGLRSGQGVLVPTMTFAATAEVVRYLGGTPILVDCEPETLHLDLDDAARKLKRFRQGNLLPGAPTEASVAGMIPVHVAGLMMDIDSVQNFARRADVWLVEDAAHAFPASWRPSPNAKWQRSGEGTADVTCFSFYANKTITTGEGGMAVTSSGELAERMRMMSLHGLSRDAWDRYRSDGSWDYRICAPGYKYNLTDIAAAIGIHQLARAEDMRQQRERVALGYFAALADMEEIHLPPIVNDRIHSWHLFPIKLKLDRLTICRDEFIKELKRRGVGCSVHWRPLHLHPYYQRAGWDPDDFPCANDVWNRLISLPIFPGMRVEELGHVVRALKEICLSYAR
jgi:dTDP-4-amino-4,6-dideoxygalactose transaminase